MALTAAGFPGSVNDIQWSELLDLASNEGIVGMQASPATGDRLVAISSGRAWVGGLLAKLSPGENAPQLPANLSSFSRVDRIILRAQWGTNPKSIAITFRQGTPSANPQAPSLEPSRRPGDHYEVSLARVTVGPGQGQLTSDDIVRENTPPATGFYHITSIGQAPAAELNALIYYTAQKSLRIPIDGDYVEIAHGRGVESKCGTATNVAFNSSGVAVINHNLGWTPTAMTFTPHLASGDGGSVYVTTRSATTPYTSTTVQVVGKETSTAARYQSTLSRIDWIAHRNV